MAASQPDANVEIEKPALPDWASRFPFMFPGQFEKTEEEEVEPPFHEDLADRAFVELYEVIFNHLKCGEKVIDALKRIPKDSEEMDEFAKYISELWVRGEINIIQHTWVLVGMNAGKIAQIQEIKWDLRENGQDSSGHTAQELAPRARVLAAEDALVKPEGTEEWIPVQNIQFDYILD